MTKIIYSDDARKDKALRKKYERMFPELAISPRIRSFNLSEKEPFKKITDDLFSLIEFYQFTRISVLELLVCINLLEKFKISELDKDDSRVKSTFSAILFFLLLYFHDYTNRVYVFNEKCKFILKTCPGLNKSGIRRLLSSEELLILQGKFRLNYVHSLRTIKTFHSLLSNEIVFCYERSGEVQIFKPKYFRNLTEASFAILTQAITSTIEEFNKLVEPLLKDRKLIMAQYEWRRGTAKTKKSILKRGRTWGRFFVSK